MAFRDVGQRLVCIPSLSHEALEMSSPAVGVEDMRALASLTEESILSNLQDRCAMGQYDVLIVPPAGA